MNLVLVPVASAVKHSPHLWKGGQVVGACINKKRVGGSPDPRNPFYECGATVKAGEGYADTEGTPWKAYYCPACANQLRSKV